MDYYLGQRFFNKHQKLLLGLLNFPVIKYLFRWIFRITPTDCPLNQRITKIAPNHFSYRERKVKRNGKYYLEGYTDFRTHNKYSKRLYYAFYPLWVLLHSWDMLIANKLVPSWNLGFDKILTAYPDAGTGNTTVDGQLKRSPINWDDGSQTWSDIRDGTPNASAHNGADATATGNDSDAMPFYLQGGSDTDRWNELTRVAYLFDTSAIGDSADIISAVLSLYVVSIDADTFSQSIGIVSCSPAIDNDLSPSDYDIDNWGTTEYASRKSLSSMTTGAYNDFTFNTDGKNYISKTGITRLGARFSKDLDNDSYWAGGNSRMQSYMADYTGTDKDPKLVIHWALLMSSTANFSITASYNSTSIYKLLSNTSFTIFTSASKTANRYLRKAIRSIKLETAKINRILKR